MFLVPYASCLSSFTGIVINIIVPLIREREERERWWWEKPDQECGLAAVCEWS